MAQTEKTQPSRLTPSPKALQKALEQSARQAQRMADAFGVMVPSIKPKNAHQFLRNKLILTCRLSLLQLHPNKKATMPQLTLTYFDMHGGRAEPARLAFHLGGIAFEDKRFAFADFAEVRKSTPLNQVPTLHVDGVQVTQSDAITRYAGKLAGLYPTDTYQALLCDEVLDAVEDANVKIGATFGLTGDALKDARTALVNGPLSLYLGWLQSQLLAHGGEFFADHRLTIADLKVFVFVRGLNSGRMDHVPTDLVEKVAPLLNAHMQRIALIPTVAKYYAKFETK